MPTTNNNNDNTSPTMTVTLTPEQAAWIRCHVGEARHDLYPTPGDFLRHLVDSAMRYGIGADDDAAD